MSKQTARAAKTPAATDNTTPDTTADQATGKKGGKMAAKGATPEGHKTPKASRSARGKSQAAQAVAAPGCACGHEHGDDHDHSRDDGSGHEDHDHVQVSAVRPKVQGMYLFSPSSAVQDPDALELARQRLRDMGFSTTVDRTALSVAQRFAGTDAQRLAAIGRALKQKSRFVMATRGGYGLSRLLPQIDWKAVADSGKVFIGHSDFTAFNLALLARTGAESYSGPAAIADFGGKTVDDLTQDLFTESLRGELEVLGFESPDADPVDARGVLWGGNLAMVASLLGTPYFPKVRGGILFLEDVGEHPYRVERMLAQLWQAGVLEKQKAIVLGRFTEYRLAKHDNGYDMDAVVRWLRATVKVPVVTGLPYGHVKVKATLPVGRKVGIATEAGMAHLVVDEHGH